MVGWLPRSGDLDVDLVVFVKDGTLLDFEATWIPGFKQCAERVALEAGEPALQPALLKAGGLFEAEDGSFKVAPDSIMRHGALRELAQHWIDTQPMIAAHWQGEAAPLEQLMQEVCVPPHIRVSHVCAPSRARDAVHRSCSRRHHVTRPLLGQSMQP